MSWRWRAVYAVPALALVLLAAALVVGVNVRRARNQQIAGELADLHVATMASPTPVDVVSSDRHTVKPWFQGKTNFAPTVPDLSANGFPLVGGRLDVLQQQRIAALVYKRQEHVINLFVVPVDSRSESPGKWDAGGYHVVSWVRNGFRYWAVSDVNADDLWTFADLFQSRL
jgi:anti-sigma factor RsiW